VIDPEDAMAQLGRNTAPEKRPKRCLHVPQAQPVAPKLYFLLRLAHQPTDPLIPSPKMTTAIDDFTWTGVLPEDRQIPGVVEVAPEGKRWECCTTCQGKGKVLVDVTITPVILQSEATIAGGVEEKRLPHQGVNSSPTEEKRRGNNRYGPRGTLRCLTCQSRKKKVTPCTITYISVNTIL
jgi:hypothetical protein